MLNSEEFFITYKPGEINKTELIAEWKHHNQSLWEALITQICLGVRPADFSIYILDHGVSDSHFPAELVCSESWQLVWPWAVWSAQRVQWCVGTAHISSWTC